MAYSINIGDSFIPMKYIRNYYKQTKYPQRLSHDRHYGYTIINKRIYYIYN